MERWCAEWADRVEGEKMGAMVVVLVVGAVGAGLAYAYKEGLLQPYIQQLQGLCGCNKDAKDK